MPDPDLDTLVDHVEQELDANAGQYPQVMAMVGAPDDRREVIRKLIELALKILPLVAPLFLAPGPQVMGAAGGAATAPGALAFDWKAFVLKALDIIEQLAPYLRSLLGGVVMGQSAPAQPQP